MALPDVHGRCPSCGNDRTLFLGIGGYVTCSWHECPNPAAANDLLENSHELVEATRIGVALSKVDGTIRRLDAGELGQKKALTLIREAVDTAGQLDVLHLDAGEQL